MLSTVSWLLAALDIERRPFCAGVIHARFAVDVDHAVLRMPLAMRCRFLPSDIEGSCCRTGGMRTTPDVDIDHTFLSMCLAVRGRLAAFHIERRFYRAGVVYAIIGADVDHAVLGMFPAE